MRPAKLYLEIFISFVLVMFVSETMIFFLFTDSERRIIGYKLEQNTINTVRLVKKLLDEKGRWSPEGELTQNEEVYQLLSQLEVLYNAQVWIAGADEIPLLKPSPGDIPSDIDLLSTDEHTDFLDEIKFHNNMSQNRQVYTSVPITAPNNEVLTLYMIFRSELPQHLRWRFFIGLSIIGIVVALLIIPVSKFITDRIKVLKESALKIAEGELSHRVSVNTVDEIGELGVAFNQMAERLERMIIGGRELTANVSHELRTPLTRIRIAQEILKERLEKGDFSKCAHHMNKIQEDIEELDTLIGRILELSKLDIHETPLNLSSFDPVSLLEELLERLDPLITHKDLTVKKELLQDIDITGDRVSLQTAFLNILDNAVKFSPEKGKIRITMTQNNTILVTEIVNTHEDLSRRDLEMIFEPFYRSRNSGASGSGLGLSISNRIIRRHGGEISAFNSPEGLEISVALPVKAQIRGTNRITVG